MIEIKKLTDEEKDALMQEQKAKIEAEKLQKELELVVKRGRRYRHFKGGYYDVIAIAKNVVDEQDYVVYVNIETEDIYTRPVSDWFTSIKDREDNQFGLRTRFTLCP